MTKKEKQNVIATVEAEGSMDYCFRYYSHFPEVKDKEFHKLREAYVEAAKSLSDYIGLEDEEEE